MTRHALVTGATGGLGRELVGQLRAVGYQVRATGRDRAIGARLGAEFLPADLVTDPLEPLLGGVDVVFHLAALSSPWGSRAAFEAINITATRRLADAARAVGCEGLVYASTPSIYAEPRDRIGLTEDSPVGPRFANDYAATKYAAERLVLAADAPGFRSVAIRPRAIVGPHDTVLLPRILRAGRRGRFPLPGGGRALIEPTDVRDAAAAFVAADRRLAAAGGQAINISGGDPRPVRELLGQLFARIGSAPRLVTVPTGLAMTMAGAMERVAALLPGRPEPPVTRYSVMTFGFSQTMQLDRARDLLDWVPRHGIEAMIAHALPEAIDA
ncbi:nucleoside-diphosphate-sugar epimerase [Sphingomonas kyeonggiensis]|uniref:Nucleoside-diphosphate-sugar epimerase n=1 Tax=Sphingomonas kyeonggiensis TaxID=1268553 RepID=A0A7W7NTG3_9SPHN|nr:NAD(P)-dependent oxidoreductase [Sphingomonas kyeonggiensis]MBB4841265.1 nucleoside-diphosphate-sugar epimerase [Sphingomonas kyeonggiensis]